MSHASGGAGEEAVQQGRWGRRGRSAKASRGHRGTNAAQYEGVWLGIGDEEEQI